MAKRILHASSTTCQESLLGELGWFKLQARRNIRKLIYWYHLMTLNNNRIIKQIYLITKNNGKNKIHSNSSNWAAKIKDILKKYGMDQLYDNNNNILYNLDGKGNLDAKTIYQHKKFWKTYVTHKVMMYEEEAWKQELKKKSKLCNYVLFKKNIKLEKYLNCNNHVIGRWYHTALRTGSNKLEIEQGRWKGIHRSRRFCKQCSSGKIEDEKHFLLFCSKYHLSRSEFFSKVKNITLGKWDFKNYHPDYSFSVLLQGTGDEFEVKIFNLFHKFLENSFKCRDS